MGRTEQLKVVTIKPYSLVHMLKQSTWGCDKDVHPGKTLALIFEILSANDDTGREAVVSAYGPQDIKYLNRLSYRIIRTSDQNTDVYTHKLSCW